MSKDKYPSIFSRQMATIYIFSAQMEAIVFIILQISFATRAVVKIGKYLRRFPSNRTRHRFPMKLGMLMLQDKEILKT